eukprot:TRINITY_DN829_c1_g2_i1.p1 TRINITY_DN829_c1_g2~~TRINITY_DN829_c1_g2_i1.p1  ORF type:complete len:336 (-),score=118.40 TRINITY_DN829_c1_g2_i1:479-1486(-)
MATNSVALNSQQLKLIFKWNGKEFEIEFSLTYTNSNSFSDQKIIDLKQLIQQKTNVPIARQRITGLKSKARPPNLSDDAALSDFEFLGFPKASKLMLIGSAEPLIEIKFQEQVAPEEQENDENEIEPEFEIYERPENLQKLERRIQNFTIKILNPPRPEKRCLVLDVDYTLFDHRSTVETAEEITRPYLHEFLTEVYPYYDIIIWSATNYSWIDIKMKKLNVLDNPNYKISFFLDHLAMITIQSEKYGVINVKPLAMIWRKFPELYSPQNTIHFDDLSRNFLMNPKNGLKIRPFKNGPMLRFTDNELRKLSIYLRNIINEPDFTRLNHKNWEDRI